MSPPTLIRFDKSQTPLILEAFGYEIREDGIVVDSKFGEPLVTPENVDVTGDNFAGFIRLPGGRGRRALVEGLPSAVHVANMLRA